MSHQNGITAWFKSYYVVWKQAISSAIQSHEASLNRTMQYGNGASVGAVLTQEKSLNRTMQYGNFHSEKAALTCCPGFKSYYVVWKPRVYMHVWLVQNMFKSYYVVWKRYACGGCFSVSFGLNRTMQYGNFSTGLENILKLRV